MIQLAVMFRDQSTFWAEGKYHVEAGQNFYAMKRHSMQIFYLICQAKKYGRPYCKNRKNRTTEASTSNEYNLYGRWQCTLYRNRVNGGQIVEIETDSMIVMRTVIKLVTHLVVIMLINKQIGTENV